MNHRDERLPDRCRSKAEDAKQTIHCPLADRESERKVTEVLFHLEQAIGKTWCAEEYLAAGQSAMPT